jgi:competence protein ComEC
MCKQVPSLRLFFPFLLGIIIWHAGLQEVPLSIYLTCVILFVVVFSILQMRAAFSKYKWNWANGVVVSLLLVFGGWGICKLQQTQLHPLHYSQLIGDSCVVKAEIVEALVQKPKSYKTIIQIQSYLKNEKEFQVIGSAYAYFTKCDTAPNLLPGTKIVLQAKPILLKPNGNPGEFNYAEYSLHNGITHSFFLTPNQYVVAQKSSFSLSSFFTICKMNCLAIIKKYITHAKAIGIAEALLVGDRNDIDADTWDAYQQTGIVHIIAISGMHLGIFYLQLLPLLLHMPFCKKHEKLTIFFCLLTMWFFSAMIGMPASVMRAAFIFTFIGFGRIFAKNSDPYNSLIISAFFLLVYHPNWILDVGCILSYAAIFGILLFAKPIEQLFYVSNKWGQEFIKTIATTLSAQIFTMPICLFYFHQFPLGLLVSNMLAIPITFIVLYVEIGILIFSLVPLIAKALAWICTNLILFLNSTIQWMSSIPYFNIQHIQISYAQLYLLMAAMIIYSWAILRKHGKSLLLGTACLVAYWIIHFQSNYLSMQQHKLIVHHAAKKSIVQIFDKNNYTILSKDTIEAGDVKNILQPAQQLYRANDAMLINSQQNEVCVFARCNSQSILIINHAIAQLPNTMAIDYLILSHNAKIPLQQIKNQFAPKHLIIDGSNSLWKIEQWKTEAKELHLQLFITAQQGAFVANL